MDSRYQDRIQELLFQNAIPETTGEELLIFMYEGGKEGKSLRDLTFEVAEEFNTASKYELEMIIIGYTVGQSHSLALEEDSNQIH